MTKINYSFSQLSKVAIASVLFVSLAVTSCKEDEQNSGATATVQFVTEAQTVSEGGGAVSVTIDFDKPASKNGTIVIELGGTAVYASDFNTRPNGSSGTVSVTVTEGQTAAQFTVHPINNALLADDKTIEVTIQDASKAFDVGSQNSIVVTITDDEGPTEANFAVSSSSIAEDVVAGNDVTINLTSEAPGTGSITLSLTSPTAVYGVDYTTEPAATNGELVLPVAEFATSVVFKVKPVDDAALNSAHQITLTITAAANVVNVGDVITSHVFTINDNEIASQAVFAAPSSSLAENVSAGIDVTISLTPQTTNAGTLTVSLASNNATYGDDYTVEGVTVTNNSFPLNVTTGKTSASFKIIPVDNAINNESLVITFTVSNPTGILTLGSGVTHDVTIVDDEIDPVLVTIADIRALYQGSPVDIETGAYIEATVTSAADNIDGQTVFVQDATGGIALQFTTTNSTLALGDVVKVNVGDENTGVQVNSTLGLIHIEGLVYSLVEETATNGAVVPEVITVAQANAGTYQGKLVTLQNVYLKEANGTETYGGTNTISNGTDEIVTIVRDSGSPQASFKDNVAAQGIGSITGIITTGAGSTPQLLLRAESDVALTLVGTLTTMGTINDFGGIDNGVTSTAQQFTVQGTTLVNNVLLNAPTSFKISTDDITYASSLNLDFNAVNAGPVTVYVKFAPATGVNGLKTGSLTISSYGSEAKSISLSGTETSSTLIITENFEYGGADNADITLATANWTRHSGTTGPQYSSTGLGYTGYNASNLGGAISFIGTASGDVNRKFTAVNTTGDVYVSFLVNVSSAAATEDYFFHLGPNTVGTVFRGRVFSRTNGAGWSLSLSKSSEANVDDNTILNFNQTYLFIIKYSFSTATASDDVVSLYVYDTGVPALEADAKLLSIGPVGAGTASDPADIGSFVIRQSTNIPTGKIDGIKVARTFSDLFD